MDWYDFLGIKKATRPSVTEAREIVRRKGIKSKLEFKERRKTDPELQLIPSNPNVVYKDEGWVDWYDFLGNQWVFLSEAKVIVRRKGIQLKNEFLEATKNRPRTSTYPK